ncbi:fumarylacetoacetate hydrolase family protein [bacterium]|nr:fumarylacetoacetate hydrolase family protein [bacterium]
MKFVTYFDGENLPRTGVLTADEEAVIDLVAAAESLGVGDASLLQSMQQMLDSFDVAFEVAVRIFESRHRLPPTVVLPLGDLRLAAPLPRPRSLRDCLAFERHLIQCMRTVAKWKSWSLAAFDTGLERVFGHGFLRPPDVWYRRPIYYKGNPASVVGHDAEVRWPPFTQRLDFELEFAVVIGRGGVNIPASRAREHIAGFTLFNDFSARDIQFDEMAGKLGPAKSKDFDTGNAFGPWLVTTESVPDPLTLRVRVNGEEWGCGTSADMHFSMEEIVEYISRDETLFPGDVIGSGTVPGCCGLELDRWIKPGDIVELEADGIGVLRNRIVRPAE